MCISMSKPHIKIKFDLVINHYCCSPQKYPHGDPLPHHTQSGRAALHLPGHLWQTCAGGHQEQSGGAAHSGRCGKLRLATRSFFKSDKGLGGDRTSVKPYFPSLSRINSHVLVLFTEVQRKYQLNF